MNIEIHPKAFFKKLLYLIFALLLFNILGLISIFYFSHNHFYGLIPLFNFSVEMNIPTFYSSLALLFASTLLSIIAISHKRTGASYASWLGLAIIFGYLAIDEIASIHERLGLLIKASLNTSGILFYTWVIPYSAALLVFMITYFKFLLRLPKETMILFITSGTIFVSGALGFELLSGLYATASGTKDLTYALLYTCEEFLEMLGIAVFIYSLLKYMASEFKPFTITLNIPR
jgi:hypothetical protein